MSEYDDCESTGTLVYGGHWLPAEPNGAQFIRRLPDRKCFAHCCVCNTVSDQLDIVVDDFGNLACYICGSGWLV